MKEYTIFSDLHFGAAKPKDKQFKISDIKFGPQVIYNGDIFDFYGMKRGKLWYWRREFEHFTMICRETKTTYIGGNHEIGLSKSLKTWHIINRTTIVTHGDLVFWDKKKSDKWRNKTKLGASGWKRALIYLKNSLWTRGLVKTKKAKIAADWAIVNGNFTKIIIGHTHVPKKQIFHVKGVEVIFLPQGESKVMI